MSESASSALSIPEAFSAPPGFDDGSSSLLRSRVALLGVAEDFLAPADFAPLPLGFEGWEASSAASWASRSAFLRAASAFLASASCLFNWLLVLSI